MVVSIILVIYINDDNSEMFVNEKDKLKFNILNHSLFLNDIKLYLNYILYNII